MLNNNNMYAYYLKFFSSLKVKCNYKLCTFRNLRLKIGFRDSEKLFQFPPHPPLPLTHTHETACVFILYLNEV